MNHVNDRTINDDMVDEFILEIKSLIPISEVIDGSAQDKMKFILENWDKLKLEELEKLV